MDVNHETNSNVGGCKKGGEYYERRPAKTKATIKEVPALPESLTVTSWKPEEADALFHALEWPNWAPWLAASAESLAGRAKTFPEGQLLVKSGGDYVASLSLNRINWNGRIADLPSWDMVAGDPTDYSQTYDPSGNSLVLLSMNVSPAWKGKRIPSALISEAKALAQHLGVEHLIGSFRPSGYGEIKKGMQYDIDFETYCLLKRTGSDKPLDPWLGSLWHMGMEMLAVDPGAMTVAVTMGEFEHYKNVYQKGLWEEIAPGIWECGEVGQWHIDTVYGIAVYTESNVWGMIPLT